MTMPSVDPVADLAEAVAGAARAVPGVLDLHAGPYGEVAVHAAGRRIGGVRVRSGMVEVHVVLRADVDLLAVADRVRDVALAACAGPGTDPAPGPDPVVEVVVEDIRIPAAGA